MGSQLSLLLYTCQPVRSPWVEAKSYTVRTSYLVRVMVAHTGRKTP